MKNKEKIISQKIELTPDKNEYILQTKKRCKWCWFLLLLLLPLLLLIPLKKTVFIKTIDTQTNHAVKNVNVYFQQDKQSVRIKDAPFFKFTRKTNADGVTSFYYIRYRLLSWFYRHNSKIVTYANTGCYASDSIVKKFHSIKDKDTLLLKLSPKLYDFEFTVVDKDDNNEPLPDAKVIFKEDRYGRIDSAISDNAGKVIFRNIPKCSNIVVIGSKYGWYNDTIKGPANQIYHNEDTLYLRQEKTIVKFYVKDLYSRKPIVNAIGYLSLKGTTIHKQTKTNINGVAKGIFENVHKIRKMRIDVNKHHKLTFYNDTSTYDYLNWVTVENWNRKPDAKKVIYIRPNPKPIDFQNIDCHSHLGLSNIENYVTIAKANGTKVGPTKFISNNNGYFSISASLGDKVTIESKSKRICPNEYRDTTVIKNVLYDNLVNNENKRKIPLCKKLPPKLKFRDIDKQTGLGIKGVKNTVKITGGATLSYTSKTGGWFTIDKVYPCQIISILADGRDVVVNGQTTIYGTNNTKINMKQFSSLMLPTPQNERDIPLEKDTLRGQSGKLRINLQWFTKDDLDLHVIDPCGNKIYYSKKKKRCHLKLGELDVDANNGNLRNDPQENVYWNHPPRGHYKVKVKFYRKNSGRSSVPFNVTILQEGRPRKDFSNVVRRQNETVMVTEFDL